MPEVFSSASNSVDVSTPILDQAPGAPNIFGVTTTSSGAIVSVRSPTMDFDEIGRASCRERVYVLV